MNPLNTTATSRLGRILLAVMASGYLLIGPISVIAETTGNRAISNPPATILVTGANRGIACSVNFFLHIGFLITTVSSLAIAMHNFITARSFCAESVSNASSSTLIGVEFSLTLM